MSRWLCLPKLSRRWKFSLKVGDKMLSSAWKMALIDFGILMDNIYNVKFCAVLKERWWFYTVALGFTTYLFHNVKKNRSLRYAIFRCSLNIFYFLTCLSFFVSSLCTSLFWKCILFCCQSVCPSFWLTGYFMAWNTSAFKLLHRYLYSFNPF